MNKKQIIGISIFVVLILVIIGIKIFSNKDEEANSLNGLETVYVATGGGKEGFIADEKVVNIMQNEYKLNVVYDDHYYCSRLGITENQGEKLSFLFGGKKKVFESTNTRIGINRTNTPSLQEQLLAFE